MRTRGLGLRGTLSRLTRLARVQGVRPTVAAPFWAVTGVHLVAQLGDAASCRPGGRWPRWA